MLVRGGRYLYVHALAEVFATLTGGNRKPRVDADIALQLLEQSVLPFVTTVTLSGRDVVNALSQAKARGVRGGAIYDFLHLVAARKSGVETIFTLDVRHFQALAKAGDPRVEMPAS